jgi:hypothetical protein
MVICIITKRMRLHLQKRFLVLSLMISSLVKNSDVRGMKGTVWIVNVCGAEHRPRASLSKKSSAVESIAHISVLCDKLLHPNTYARTRRTIRLSVSMVISPHETETIISSSATSSLSKVSPSAWNRERMLQFSDPQRPICVC